MKHPNRPGRIRTADALFLTVLVASVAAIMLLRGTGGAPAEDVARGVALFEQTATFDDAMSRARESGKPVFVLASADWCPPCQQFKGTTLADDEVKAAISASVVPYFLDVTDSSSLSAEDAQLAQSLGVRGIPALYIVADDGSTVASATGYQAKDRFVGWLADATR